MDRRISQRELRNDSGAILRAVEAGEGFVVTRNGTPLARLTPLPRRRYASRHDLVAAARHMAPLDAGRFRADVDAALDQDVDA